MSVVTVQYHEDFIARDSAEYLFRDIITVAGVRRFSGKCRASKYLLPKPKEKGSGHEAQEFSHKGKH